MSLVFNKEQQAALNKQFNKSKNNTAYTKTILAGKLDEAFKRFNEPFSFVYEPKQSDFGWHPSGDCLPPVSKLWQNARAALYPEESTVVRKDMSHLTKTFMVGHYWHQIIQYLIVKEGWASQEAIENIAYRCWNAEANYAHTFIVGENYLDCSLDPDNPKTEALPFHFVRGQGDVAPLEMGDWKGLVDIKTMNPADFKAGLGKSRFANKYLAQINIYMDLFDEEAAMILAVDKGSGSFAEYTFVRDDALVSQIYDKWEFVSQFLESGEEPTTEHDNEFALSIGDEK